MNIGETDYHQSARERLNEAGVLLEEEFYAGSVYLAGRAVELMLRAIIWKYDPDFGRGFRSLETGHDLRSMLALVRSLGILRDHEIAQAVDDGVQFVGRLWFNNMRFVPTKKLKSDWWQRGEIGRRRTLKMAVTAYYDACSELIKRCEVLYGSAQ